MADVALLAEGVDRNVSMRRMQPQRPPSPSSRRAWIEISACSKSCLCCSVALLAEGVDRNVMKPRQQLIVARRPPRGGRG